MVDFIEENTLSDLKLYTKVREQLRQELGHQIYESRGGATHKENIL